MSRSYHGPAAKGSSCGGAPQDATRHAFETTLARSKVSRVAADSSRALYATETRAAGPLDRDWAATHTVPRSGGLEVVDVFDGRPALDEDIGSACVSFLNPGGAAQAYFRLSRPHRFCGRPIEVEVEILADSEDEICPQYDSLVASVRVVRSHPGAFKRTRPQYVRRTGAWHCIRFFIDDGRFSRLTHGGDFRVVSGRPAGVPLHI